MNGAKEREAVQRLSSLIVVILHQTLPIAYVTTVSNTCWGHQPFLFLCVISSCVTCVWYHAPDFMEDATNREVSHHCGKNLKQTQPPSWGYTDFTLTSSVIYTIYIRSKCTFVFYICILFRACCGRCCRWKNAKILSLWGYGQLHIKDGIKWFR